MEVAHEARLETQLVAFVARSNIVMRALEAARSLNLRSWCIGAGAIRNLVWDNLHGFKTETMPEDIDLVFHDASDLSSERERLLEKALAQAEPAFRWEAVNQASVHHWLKSQGALEVQPYQTLVEGIASWPEVATCVGVTLSPFGKIEVLAPHGLADLFEMLVRWNPGCVSKEVYLERIAKKRFAERWPMVKVLAC
jgi:hypothetical protein